MPAGLHISNLLLPSSMPFILLILTHLNVGAVSNGHFDTAPFKERCLAVTKGISRHSQQGLPGVWCQIIACPRSRYLL